MNELNSREKQLAHGCPLTFVTETDICRHTVTRYMPEMVKQAFGYKLGLYDILSYSDLDCIDPEQNPGRWRVFVTDMVTATGLHNVEDVLILSRSLLSSRKIAAALQREKGLERLRIISDGFCNPVALPTSRVVLTCMDYRLHRDSGRTLRNLLSKAVGPGDAYLLTTAGVAKELGEDTPRRELIVEELSSLKAKYELKELVFLSHQDCGKYGGSSAFPDEVTEMERYCSDMAAAEALGSGFGLRVRCGIIGLEADVPVSIKMIR
jgi:hypothetical protein